MQEQPQHLTGVAEVKPSFLRKTLEGAVNITREALARVRNIHIERDVTESEKVLQKLTETRIALAAAEKALVDEARLEEAASEIIENNSHEIFLQDHLVVLRDAMSELETVVEESVLDYLDWQIAGNFREREAVLEASKSVVSIKGEIAALERKISEKHEPYESARYRLAMSLSQWAASRGASLYQDIESMPDDYKNILSTTTIGSTQQAEKLFGLFAQKFASALSAKQAEPTWQNLSLADRADETRKMWEHIAAGLPFLAQEKDLGELVYTNLDYVSAGGLDSASADKQALVEKRNEDKKAQEVLETLVPDTAAYNRVLANINTMSKTVFELPQIEAESVKKAITYMRSVSDRLEISSQDLAKRKTEEEAALEATFTQDSPVVVELKAKTSEQGISPEITEASFSEAATPRILMRELEAQESKMAELRGVALEVFADEHRVREVAKHIHSFFLRASDMSSIFNEKINNIRGIRDRKAALGTDPAADVSTLDQEEKTLTEEYLNLTKDLAAIIEQISRLFSALNQSMRQEIESQKDVWDYIPKNGSAVDHALNSIKNKIAKIQNAGNLDNGLLPLALEISADIMQIIIAAKIACSELAKSKAQKVGELGDLMRGISKDKKFRKIVKEIVMRHEIDLAVTGQKKESVSRYLNIIRNSLSKVGENVKVSDIVDIIVADLTTIPAAT